jgi:hypothetical protein
MDLRACLRSGWYLFARDPKAALLISLAVVGPIVALQLAVQVVLSHVGVAAPDEPPWTAWSIRNAAMLLEMLILPALGAGASACCLGAVRSGDLTTHNLGVGFSRWWACTWVTWLPFLAFFLFSSLLVLPMSFVLLTPAWLGVFHIVDTDCGGIRALRYAWGAMPSAVWQVVLLTFLTCLMIGAGFWVYWAVLFVSSPLSIAAHRLLSLSIYAVTLFTLPIGLGALAAAYDALSKRERAAAQ